MRAFLAILLSGSLIILSNAQTGVVSYNTQNVYIEKGDYYFGKRDYKKAIVYYNMALSNDANYYSVLKKAEAYEKLHLVDQAVECYRILFQSTFEVPSEYYLKYAFLLLKKNDIKGFEIWMSRYNENVASDINNKSSKKFGAEMYKDSAVIIVENESMLNTAESEICPVVYQNTLCFASTRKNLTGSKGNDFYNLYAANFVKGGKLGKLNLFNKSINSTQNENSVVFSEATKSMYFTRSTTSSLNLRDINLNTYKTKIPTDKNYNLTLHDFNIDDFGRIGQISFNSDGTKIYFVSEKSGGLGGSDIYTSELINGVWSAPANMGNINTSKDELYPFVLNDSLLYFTSDGLKGMGGLDLYYVNLNQNNSSPVNLGSKVNTKYDELCLSFTSGGITGYFSSNRPGGFGKEDIYRLHLLNLKVKKPAFQFKRKPSIEDHKINLYLSDGTDYNIASKDNAGFKFSFQPQEAYKMVIQHENPLATEIIKNTKLSDAQRAKDFLIPAPYERTEIELESGMRYQFTVGMKPISDEYKKALNNLSADYQSDKSSTIDLTALAKELQLKEGEIYTIRFEKDENLPADNKSEEITQLYVNDNTIDVAGRSFFVVLPLDIQTSFNISTDLEHFKETFNPKKTGALNIDAEPVIKVKPVILSKGFPILVNTQSINDDFENLTAKNLSITPGTFYLFTLTKSFPGTDQKLEIFIPLTKGVRYNITKDAPQVNAFNNEVSEMVAEKGADTGEERIDISVLSKELDISPEDSIMFSLTPVEPKGSKTANANNALTVLDVDGMMYIINPSQKLKVHLEFEQNMKVNIQTDLDYIKENFDPTTIALNVDKTALSENVAEESKKIITDPVFDVIVINFDKNEYAIRPDAKTVLDNKVINVLSGDQRIYVTIKGYTDPLGDAAYNEKLSKNRAQTVKDYLTSNGIGENRIRTFSFGETLALKKGQSWEDLSEAELQKHRKVEIVMYLPK